MGRRSFLIGLVSAAALSEVDVAVAADPASADDEGFMRMALDEARRADFPFGACVGAILWSHIARLVYAASVTQIATKMDQIMLSSAEVAAKAPFAPSAITGGVLAAEAMPLFAT